MISCDNSTELTRSTEITAKDAMLLVNNSTSTVGYLIVSGSTHHPPWDTVQSINEEINFPKHLLLHSPVDVTLSPEASSSAIRMHY